MHEEALEQIQNRLAKLRYNSAKCSIIGRNSAEKSHGKDFLLGLTWKQAARIRQRQPLPAVSACAASTRGTRIVAGLARSLRFPTFARLHPPGNSHSRGPCPLLAIPDVPPACILRGTRIVAGLARSLRFPTLRLPASATGGGRLRSHRRRAGFGPTGGARAIT